MRHRSRQIALLGLVLIAPRRADAPPAPALRPAPRPLRRAARLARLLPARGRA